jgi:hypothetical protein
MKKFIIDHVPKLHSHWELNVMEMYERSQERLVRTNDDAKKLALEKKKDDEKKAMIEKLIMLEKDYQYWSSLLKQFKR